MLRAVIAWAVAVLIVAAGVGVALEATGVPVNEGLFTPGTVGPAFGAALQDDEAAAGPELPSVGDPTDDGGTDAPSPTADPTAGNGDLGLSVPISSPACDSTWVVFLGASTNPAMYETQISALLASQPGSQYLVTQGGCSSMRQQLPDGSLIYAVYLGPFPDQASACSVRAEVGGPAYVKRMDDVTPADQLWEC